MSASLFFCIADFEVWELPGLVDKLGGAVGGGFAEAEEAREVPLVADAQKLYAEAGFVDDGVAKQDSLLDKGVVDATLEAEIVGSP